MSPLLLTVLSAATLATQAPSGSSLESSLKHVIKASGAEVAVAYRTLDGRDEVLIDPDKTHAHQGFRRIGAGPAVIVLIWWRDRVRSQPPAHDCAAFPPSSAWRAY